VTDNDKKYALLLHTAGMDVQDIFFTLPDGAGDDKYAKALNLTVLRETVKAFEDSAR
jgi:hypothetical protein